MPIVFTLGLLCLLMVTIGFNIVDAQLLELFSVLVLCRFLKFSCLSFPYTLLPP